MMREQLPAALKTGTISLLAAAALLCGCRQKPAAPMPSEADSEAARVQAAGAHPPAWYRALSDDALLSQHDEKGLELALRMDAPSYPNGAPIPFRVLIRDRAATEPIAAGLCSGLSLAWERVDDGTTGIAEIDNHRCFDTIPSPDEEALTRGAVKTVDITQTDASHTTFAPGRYLVNLSWQPYKAGRGTIMDRQPYATLRSNVIEFRILP